MAWSLPTYPEPLNLSIAHGKRLRYQWFCHHYGNRSLMFLYLAFTVKIWGDVVGLLENPYRVLHRQTFFFYLQPPV